MITTYQHVIPAAVTWKLMIVGLSHCVDELFDIIPVEPFNSSPGGAVPTN